MIAIMARDIQIVNTDKQRRCYDGCHYSSKLVWGKWKLLEFVDEDRYKDRLKFWKELNDYAVSERGENAKREFKIVFGEVNEKLYT